MKPLYVILITSTNLKNISKPGPNRHCKHFQLKSNKKNIWGEKDKNNSKTNGHKK